MTRYRVLVADDDRFIRDLLRAELIRRGYDVILARDGEEAVEKAYGGQPDLILLDTVMPNRNGLETLDYLRSDPSLSRIPVMMLTALRSQGDVASATRLGAVGYIAKPFNVQELCRRVGLVFESMALAPKPVLL